MALNIFLSWSGEPSLQCAEVIKHWLKDVFREKVDPWSSKEIEAGARWLVEIGRRLRDSDFGIICLTYANFDAPWLLFEAGALAKRFEGTEESHVCPLLIGLNEADIPQRSPLRQFQFLRADEAGLRKLATTINRGLSEPIPSSDLNSIITDYWQKAQNDLAPLNEQLTSLATFEFTRRRFTDECIALRQCPVFRHNSYLRDVISGVAHDYAERVHEATTELHTIRLPYTLYPKMLISLQKSHKSVVKAIAFVDAEETFWGGQMGKQIRETAHESSTRVFVFKTRDDLRRHLPELVRHARKYNVKVASRRNLGRAFPDYQYDYSIIGDPEMRLLARYDSDRAGTEIAFVTDRNEVSHHEDAIMSIISSKVTIALKDQPTDIDSPACEAFIESVFVDPDLTPLRTKQVEMSLYIPVHSYDQHEEEHAHYVEMMQSMVEFLKGHAGDRRPRVLELGAGTGIFTRRLLSSENVDVTAVEIDWACYTLLVHSIERQFRTALHGARTGDKEFSAEIPSMRARVRCFNRDSRVFDPDGAEGKFDCIVSSFADHHIKPYDKDRYFRNIMQNLIDQGIVIVGDEFLPEHDRTTRADALRAYHNYIIGEAERGGCLELVALEKAALKSGLEELGDFKLSCSQYEDHVRRIGFRIRSSKRIGPSHRDDVGGVYVYILDRGTVH